MDKTALGDRMKMYERLETADCFLPLIPVYARIDGRSFSKFTKGLEKPFSTIFHLSMDEVAEYLVEQTGAKLAYVQSDEINLFWHSVDIKSQIFFNGKKHKMTSQLAALATAKMVEIQQELWPDKPLPTFDARVFQLPWAVEVMNCFLWRQRDAIKNSVSMLASTVFSHQQLQGKSHNQRLQMLCEKGILWQDYPERCKSGVFIRKQPVEIIQDQGSILRNRLVKRYCELDKIENRIGFIYGEEAVMKREVEDCGSR